MQEETLLIEKYKIKKEDQKEEAKQPQKKETRREKIVTKNETHHLKVKNCLDISDEITFIRNFAQGTLHRVNVVSDIKLTSDATKAHK